MADYMRLRGLVAVWATPPPVFMLFDVFAHVGHLARAVSLDTVGVLLDEA